MHSSSAPTLDQALALARRLAPRDQAQLIARLAEELANKRVHADNPSAPFALPVLEGGRWDDSLPLRRKELYDDDERC